MGSIKEYWHMWLWRDTATRIITINFIVWMVVGAGCLIAPKPELWLSWFLLPGIDSLFPARFWTLFTYMFTHVDFMHMFVNMTWLLIFGQLFSTLQSQRRLVVVYIYGGLCGAVAFLAYNALAADAHLAALGASCSVLAVIGAVMVLAPQWRIPLFVFGSVKVVWIGVAAIVFFVILAPGGDTFAAHLAGLLMGVIYAVLRNNGIDIAKPSLKICYYIEAALNGNLSSRPRQQVHSNVEHEELDQLLGKVSRSGYASLSPAERQRLFELSQKIKH